MWFARPLFQADIAADRDATWFRASLAASPDNFIPETRQRFLDDQDIIRC
jgi:hypothetical protein